MNSLLTTIIFLLCSLLFPGDFEISPDTDANLVINSTDSSTDEGSIFDFINGQDEVLLHLSEDLKQIKKDFDKDTSTLGTILIKAGGKELNLQATYELGGKSRRKICRMPPVKINLKKKELEANNFVKKCDKTKIVFQCNTSKSMAESIKKEKFIYDLHNLVSEYGHRAKLVKVQMKDDKKIYEGFLLESDDDIEHRTNTEILKNKTIATTVVDRHEYLKMCLFQFMIANADWSARKGHNTDLFKRNIDNSLVIVPYDFDYAGMINNSYALAPENLPITEVTQRYFMDKQVKLEELTTAVDFFMSIQNDIYTLCDNANYLSDGSKKKVKKFIEEFYKIISNEKRVKRMIN